MSALIPPIVNVKAILIAWACGAVISAVVTHQILSWRADSVELAGVKTETKQVVKEQERRSGIAAKFEGDRRGIDRYFEAQRAEYQSWLGQQTDAVNCSLDADGLRIWNAANSGPAGNGSSADGALRDEAATREGRPIAEPASEPPSSSQELPPSVHPAQRTD